MTRPLPSPEDLVTLIEQSLLNASGLLKESRVLLDAGYAPRAHALATLALEEIGKSHLCILAAGLAPSPVERCTARAVRTSGLRRRGTRSSCSGR